MHLFDSLALKAISIFFTLLSWIPLKTGRAVGARLGELGYALDKRHRRVAIENLTLALGDEKTSTEIRQLSRQVFKNLGKILFEMAWSLTLKPRDLSKYVTIEGFAHYRNARMKRKGVLILTGHLGNWELMTFMGKIANAPTQVVYRPLDFKPMDRFIAGVRTRFGARLIPKSKATLRILKSLKRAEMVVILFDQRVNKRKGIFVDFFGEPACTTKGLAFLALKTGSPVVPMFLFRTPDGFRAEFGAEMPLLRSGYLEADIRINTQRYNDCLETFVRRYPDQWFWVHRRWKLKPDT